MKSQIVVDGARRLQSSSEFQARLTALRSNIRVRYAEDLAVAGFWQRQKLEFRIAREFRRERKKLFPSPTALYFAAR